MPRAYQMRPQFGEFSLTPLGESGEQGFTRHHSQDGVSQKLQQLVIRTGAADGRLHPLATFMRERTVGERLLQQLGPAKAMAEHRLQLRHCPAFHVLNQRFPISEVWPYYRPLSILEGVFVPWSPAPSH